MRSKTLHLFIAAALSGLKLRTQQSKNAQRLVRTRALGTGVIGGITLLALVVPLGAHSRKAGLVTTCACLGRYDAKGELLHESLLAQTPLVNGTRISSGFGMRMHPILRYCVMHWGVDFAANYGTPIYTTGDGIIEEARPKGGYGNYVRVRHSSTYATAYAHASRFAPGIYPGARVRQGQVIAYVGSTGLSVGPHLHYEVFVKRWRVNPACGCVRPTPRRPHRKSAGKHV